MKEQYKLAAKAEGFNSVEEYNTQRSWERQSNSIDRKYNPMLTKAIQAQEDAKLALDEYNKKSFFSKSWSGESKEEADYRKASEKVLDYQRKEMAERLRAAEALPRSEEHTSELQSH